VLTLEVIYYIEEPVDKRKQTEEQCPCDEDLQPRIHKVQPDGGDIRHLLRILLSLLRGD
jgi:hypothetical protein